MQINDICHIVSADTPIIATAIHAGHNMSENLYAKTKLTNLQRHREEDPFTDIFAKASKSYITVRNSRFEVDINRPRERAVYKLPEDAWGFDMWKEELNTKEISQSMAQHDLFYSNLREILNEQLKIHDKLIVLDIHSYNHRRNGPKAPFDDTIENPEVIIGTETMHDRSQWAHIIDSCINSFSSHPVMGRYLDVRENVKFGGGNLASWIHDNYPDSICCLSIEFKKIFMNEWNGKADERCISEIQDMVREAIDKIKYLL